MGQVTHLGTFCHHCHVVDSDVAPGFRVEEMIAGGRWACLPQLVVVVRFRSCMLAIVCKSWCSV